MGDYKPQHRLEGDGVDEATEDNQPTLTVSNKVYDRLRFFALVMMPALMTAYSGISSALNIPYLEQVLVISTVINTLLGVLVRQLRKSFEESDARYDGKVDVGDYDEEEGITPLNVVLNPEAIAGKHEVIVKVNKPTD